MEESLLSLTASLLRHYGGETPHPSLPRLDALLEKGFRNVAVLLFDGMGESVLREWLPADAFLRRHEAGTLSSVFPPTTVAATTTLMTGLSPIEHGWLGWNLFFPGNRRRVGFFQHPGPIRREKGGGLPGGGAAAPLCVHL